MGDFKLVIMNAGSVVDCLARIARFDIWVDLDCIVGSCGWLISSIH